MNPWIAHLENQDLQWIVENGRGLYFDPGVEVMFPKPSLILDGELNADGRVRGGGALLGLAEWYLDASERATWQVDTAVWALELPLTDFHRAHWSIALAVALSAEARLLLPENHDLADVEAATLKFRYVLNRLETSY